MLFFWEVSIHGMVGRKMESSGISEVLMEAGLILSGSILGVLNGKNYSRATRCHKLLYEALHRLLMIEFTKVKENEVLLNDVLQSCQGKFVQSSGNVSKDEVNEVINDVLMDKFVTAYSIFCENVRH